MEIVLASQSPYRRAQLEAFGLKFTAAAPRVNEEELKRRGPPDLAELTRFLAGAKAESLREAHPQAVILGSDQLVECEGRRLDKPGTAERARAQLAGLSGRAHRLITSLVMLRGGERFVATDVTEIRFRPLSPELIAAYVALDEPLDCAGSYKIEKAGLGLVASLESADPSAIQGLPLLSLSRGLDALGVPLASLWS